MLTPFPALPSSSALAVTGCGSSPDDDGSAEAAPSGTNARAVPVAASVETTATLGVRGWAITVVRHQAIVIDGHDGGGKVRQQFRIEPEHDASGDANIVSVSRVVPRTTRLRMQINGGQAVSLSNDFAGDSRALQALKLLSTDLQSVTAQAKATPARRFR
jgi:hypothetical protein